MYKKSKQILLLIILILIFITINYSSFDNTIENFLLNYELAKVERIIDADTIVIENSTSVRLLGINAPEKGERFYNESKEFLEKLISDKEVKLEYGKDKLDKYNRVLAYVYLDDKNINLELVNSGYANYYFPSGKDMYYNEFQKAWEECINKNINLCEKSNNVCVDCVILKEFNHEDEIIILENTCSFNCELTSWEIKDEGRKNFIFSEFVLVKNSQVKIIVGEGIDNNEELFWNRSDYVWTNSGDTLFLRDKEGKLVLWKSY